MKSLRSASLALILLVLTALPASSVDFTIPKTWSKEVLTYTDLNATFAYLLGTCIGTGSYTANNYVTDATTLTAAIDALDQALAAAEVAATTSAAGPVELATDAEVQTGTDTTRAITPANLQACTATTTRKGVAELATTAEVQTGTDAARVPPVSALMGHEGICKGWVNFTGTGTVTVNDHFNASSVTDGGTGLYTVYWDTTFAGNYVAAGMTFSSANLLIVSGLAGGSSMNLNSMHYNGTLTDSPRVYLLAIGDR